MRMIVFDGGFQESEVEWLTGDPAEDAWRAANGFEGESWSAGESYGPVHIQVTHHNERQAWLVLLGGADSFSEFLIEGDLNYLRFMFSPFCGAVLTHEPLVRMEAIGERAFTAWHRHGAPYDLDDHHAGVACDLCDPTGRRHRQEARQREVERQGQAREFPGS